jgi:hypothetical protein
VLRAPIKLEIVPYSIRDVFLREKHWGEMEKFNRGRFTWLVGHLPLTVKFADPLVTLTVSVRHPVRVSGDSLH